MKCSSSSHNNTIPIHATSSSVSGQFKSLTFKNRLLFTTSASPSPFTVSCKDRRREDDPLSPTSAYDVLGIIPGCSSDELKAAFRIKVKEFHPDVRKDGDSDFMIRRVIQAYEERNEEDVASRIDLLHLKTHLYLKKSIMILSKYNKSEIIERECLDPFDKPECEAYDIFVNEIMCIGNGCPYSCVQAAPHAFSFTSSTRTARATSQGHGEDYRVQLAVGQCPRSCIHYVTPSQRIILEELLDCSSEPLIQSRKNCPNALMRRKSDLFKFMQQQFNIFITGILGMPFDASVEAELLYSLVVKAKFENNRYRKPKKQENASTGSVDWL